MCRMHLLIRYVRCEEMRAPRSGRNPRKIWLEGGHRDWTGLRPCGDSPPARRRPGWSENVSAASEQIGNSLSLGWSKLQLPCWIFRVRNACAAPELLGVESENHEKRTRRQDEH